MPSIANDSARDEENSSDRPFQGMNYFEIVYDDEREDYEFIQHTEGVATVLATAKDPDDLQAAITVVVEAAEVVQAWPIALPVIESCDGCCACCMEMGSPPGYAAIVFGGKECWPEDTGDAERLAKLPAEAMSSLLEHVYDQEHDSSLSEGPCCWLDQKTKTCRFYEHRPDICRQFERSSEACHGWRKEYP